MVVTTRHPAAILSLHDADMPAGFHVDVQPVLLRRDISEAWATAIFTVAASIPATVIANTLATLLMEHLKRKRSTVVTINRIQVDLEHGELVRVIKETIHVENDIDAQQRQHLE